MNLIIDIGNTYAKLALFQADRGNQLKELHKEAAASLEKALKEIIKQHDIGRCIIASVVDLPPCIEQLARTAPFPVILLNSQTALPIRIAYSTPATLGSDRIAAVVGAYTEHPGKDILVIDAGTAITYDFISSEGIFYGGNIAPGKQMRFKALHHFTNQLPLIDEIGEAPVTGHDTATAIRGGVMQGIEYEIKGYITRYKEKHPELLVFLTGGDAKLFEDNLKNCIFADYFLVLKGLNRILNYNDSI